MGNECRVPSHKPSHLDVKQRQFLIQRKQTEILLERPVLKAVKSFDRRPPKLPKLNPLPENTKHSLSSFEEDIIPCSMTHKTTDTCSRSRRRLETQSDVAGVSRSTRSTYHKATATGILPSVEDFMKINESMTYESDSNTSGCLLSAGDSPTSTVQKLRFGRFETIR